MGTLCRRLLTEQNRDHQDAERVRQENLRLLVAPDLRTDAQSPAKTEQSDRTFRQQRRNPTSRTIKYGHPPCFLTPVSRCDSNRNFTGDILLTLSTSGR